MEIELTDSATKEVLDRLMEERTELILKSHKLRQFLTTKADTIGGRHVQLLQAQLNTMIQYIHILTERTALMQGELDG